MSSKHPSDHHQQRLELMDELCDRYEKQGWKKRLLFLRKKYIWIFFISCSRLVKRSLDIGISASLLILLSPLLLIIALLIKAQDGGPVLYVTDRVGKWGRHFRFPKFRSMLVDADQIKEALKESNQHKEGVTFKMAKDPRVTGVGRIIRKTSLDELPQLWCVLKGEMSLVGPRPPVPKEVAQYTLEDRRRLDHTPGITCIWQVSGRADIPFDKQVQLDIEYIESQSFWTDLRILFQTIPAVLLGKGAY